MIFTDERRLLDYLKSIPNNIAISFRTVPAGFEVKWKEIK